MFLYLVTYKYLRINNETRLNNSICNAAFSIQELSKYKSPILLFGDLISFQSVSMWDEWLPATLNRSESSSHEGNWIKFNLPVWWEFITDEEEYNVSLCNWFAFFDRCVWMVLHFYPQLYNTSCSLCTIDSTLSQTNDTTGHLLTQRPTLTNLFMLILKVRIMVHLKI